MSLKAKLGIVLEPWELNLLPHSYDVIGDIAVVRVPEAVKHRNKEIAEAIMDANKHVKTVLRQVSPVLGDLRLRELVWVAGEKRTETIYKEHECFFKVDLERCYFSPRLLYERRRIAQQVRPNEAVVNMFSGAGCFSIIIAKHSKCETVYSIDINPAAIKYQRENVRLNNVVSMVKPMLGNAGELVKEKLKNTADRVLMPLPEKAYEYLEYAMMALKPDKGIIHYYDFAHANKDEKPVDKVKEKVSEKLQDLNASFDIFFGRIVRPVGPRWFQVVLDILVYKKS